MSSSCLPSVWLSRLLCPSWLHGSLLLPTSSLAALSLGLGVPVKSNADLSQGNVASPKINAASSVCWEPSQ
jgi:hypothetical protein